MFKGHITDSSMETLEMCGREYHCLGIDRKMPLPSFVFAVEVRCNSDAVAMGMVLCFMFLRQRSQTKNRESVIKRYKKECKKSEGKNPRPTVEGTGKICQLLPPRRSSAHGVAGGRGRISEPED